MTIASLLKSPVAWLLALSGLALIAGPGYAQASGALSGSGEPPTWCLLMGCGVVVMVVNNVTSSS